MNTRRNIELIIILKGNLHLSQKWQKPYRQRFPQPEGGLWVAPCVVPTKPVSQRWWLLRDRLHSWTSLQTHPMKAALGLPADTAEGPLGCGLARPSSRRSCCDPGTCRVSMSTQKQIGRVVSGVRKIQEKKRRFWGILISSFMILLIIFLPNR